MKTIKKLMTVGILGLFLITLTACGFKLNNEELSKDGGVYEVGEQIWKFKKDGTIDVFNKDGKPEGDNTQYKYTVKDKEKNYVLTIDQLIAQSGEDYSIKINQEIVLDVPKSKQSIDNFKGTVKSTSIKDVTVNAQDEDMKNILSQHFSKDTLNQQLKDFNGKDMTFIKKDVNYLKDKQQKQLSQTGQSN